LEKAANQNNPDAMDQLGNWFRDEGNDAVKAISYYRAAVDLGWSRSLDSLGIMLRREKGCTRSARDLRRTVVYSAKAGSNEAFWQVLDEARRTFQKEPTKDDDFNQLCYSLGCGMYWCEYGSWKWDDQNLEQQKFGRACLDYYCETVELQQKSIFTFLLCWNRTVGGKDVGGMIGKLVWDGRADYLVKNFEHCD
jgi:hypothetical protein